MNSAVDKYTADSINIFPRDVNNNPLYVLNQNDDLNNCLIPGTYICSSNLIAETLQNTPYTTGNFKLFVIQNTGISNTGKWLSQTLFSTSGYLYHRGYDKDTYTNWKCLTDDYSSKSLTINGYIVFINELILQWFEGKKSENDPYIAAGATYTREIPLPISFSNKGGYIFSYGRHTEISSSVHPYLQNAGYASNTTFTWHITNIGTTSSRVDTWKIGVLGV